MTKISEEDYFIFITIHFPFTWAILFSFRRTLMSESVVVAKVVALRSAKVRTDNVSLGKNGSNVTTRLLYSLCTRLLINICFRSHQLCRQWLVSCDSSPSSLSSLAPIYCSWLRNDAGRPKRASKGDKVNTSPPHMHIYWRKQQKICAL